MPAVTQRVDNYLGGVSRQSDDKKLPGQVEECLNGYPDPTFGLTKRPGFKWIANLGTGTTYDNSKWFYIARTDNEKYIGCITPASGGSTGAIYIWNAITGTPANVTYGTGAQAYLTATSRTDYHVLTVQDTSIITNKTQQVGVETAPTFVAKSQATIKLIGDVGSVPYEITIAGQTPITHTAAATDKYSDVLSHFKTQIESLSTSQSLGLTVTQTADSLYISRSTAFTITGIGGVSGDKLLVFQDQVSTIADLPNESKHNHVVKILNSGTLGTEYYVKYTADDSTSGPGFWSESVAPDVSLGLTNSTMPHELVNPSVNNFTFQQIDYTDRKVGDDNTNKHPSFNGQTIQQAFFHNNRLGFLSTDNVSMSQAIDLFNFYHTSAQTVTDADPIDLKATTIRPAALHSALPTTQGLVLFSANQQFLLSATDGILTPSKANIRAIANYEMDSIIEPVDTGTTLNFISKTASYTRIFAMITRGENENPQVLDIGKIVNEWVPSNIDTFISSPQNQFIALSGQSSRYIYFFRTYSDGEKNLVQAWFNWQAPGNVQTIAADSDELFAVIKHGSQVTLSKASLSQSPEDAIIVNNEGKRINPCIDLYAEADNGQTGANNKKVVYATGSDVNLLASSSTVVGQSGTDTITNPFGETQAIPWINAAVAETFDTIFVYQADSHSTPNTMSANYSATFYARTNQGSCGLSLHINERKLEADWDDLANDGGLSISTPHPADSRGRDFLVDTTWRRIGGQVAFQGSSHQGQLAEFDIEIEDTGNNMTATKVYIYGLQLEEGSVSPLEESVPPFSKCYTPYTHDSSLTPVIIIKGSTATGNFIESGFTISPETGSDSYGSFFKVPEKDLTSVASDVIVGYKYNFDVTLPKTYFKLDDAKTKSDFTANLTIARMKFAVGLSGVMGFKLKSKGVRQGKREYIGDGSTTVFSWNPSDFSYIDKDQIKVKINNVVTTAFTVNSNTQLTLNSAPANGATVLIYLDEWYNLNPVAIADQYLANDIALADQSVFTLPIHQKSDNFTLRLFNDTPFPVALNSMMWEGIYSPRFYRRN